MYTHINAALKPVRWVASSLKDLRSFPAEVQRNVGYALYAAQRGELDPSAKPLKGFRGASVIEIVAPFDGDTWRAIYTVRLKDVIYVLHAFQKKSKAGRTTPKREIDLIQQRLAAAERDCEERQHGDESKTKDNDK
jgi:phage-related protein